MKHIVKLLVVFSLSLFISCSEDDKQTPSSPLDGEWVGTFEWYDLDCILACDDDDANCYTQCHNIDDFTPKDIEIIISSASIIADFPDYEVEGNYFSNGTWSLEGDELSFEVDFSVIGIEFSGMFICEYDEEAQTIIGEMVTFYNKATPENIEQVTWPTELIVGKL